MTEWLRERDIAWTAGLYEGEGTVYLVNKKRWPVVQLNMTDREPIERLQRIWGGRIHGPYHNGPNRKPIWRWNFTGRDAIATLFECIWDDLSPRRQEQAARVMEAAVSDFQRPTTADCATDRPHSTGPEWHRRRGEPPCQRCRDNEAQYRRRVRR